MVGFTREEAGWEWMSFAVNRLLPGQSLESAHRGRGDGPGMARRTLGRRLGSRGTIRRGQSRMYSTAFLIRSTCQAESRVTVKAETVCEIAQCRVPSKASSSPGW